MEKIIVYTGGDARGNPGKAAIAVNITDSKGEFLQEVKQSIGNGTNTFAHYYAVMVALQTLIEMYGPETNTRQFEIMLPSELVQKQLSHLAQIKEPGLVPLFIEIHNLRVASFPLITFTLIESLHNKTVERLVAEVLDGI